MCVFVIRERKFNREQNTMKWRQNFEGWTEDWYNGSYPARVYIYKKVLNRYNNSLTVEIICKTHSQNAKAGDD